MSFVQGFGPCCGCGRVFGFNPDTVPSIRLTRGDDGAQVYDPDGEREPICRTCVDRVNPVRVAAGLEAIVVMPDSYEAAEWPV